jgi:hypothetical protein
VGYAIAYLARPVAPDARVRHELRSGQGVSRTRTSERCYPKAGGAERWSSNPVRRQPPLSPLLPLPRAAGRQRKTACRSAPAPRLPTGLRTDPPTRVWRAKRPKRSLSPSFVFTCPDGSSFAFQLPCQVGMSPLNVTECFALGDNVREVPIWSAIMPLGYLASHLNEPIDLDQFPSVPSNSTWSSDGGTTYGILRAGALVVSEVDPTGRSFVGRLQNVQAVRTPPIGEATFCSARDSPFWVVPGNFN